AEGAVAVHAGPWLPAGTATVADAVSAFVASRAEAGPGPAHLAVHAYLDRESDASVAVLRAELARRTGLTTTFDWAPRGPRATAEGALVCQLTGDPDDADPELDGLRALQQRMARTDAGELARRGHPVLRLHLADRLAGLVGGVRAVQHL
ncbi:MAG: glucose-6-phosphate isomerase, partial [Pseudonocardia sp.]|nr:glucose-6-phosphate isomerase [Pseudonocardia sp.]